MPEFLSDRVRALCFLGWNFVASTCVLWCCMGIGVTLKGFGVMVGWHDGIML